MLAAVLYAPRDLRIKAVADPEPKEGEVTIRVKAAGLCGTDLAVYQGEHPSRSLVVMGHEYAGIVEATGSRVEGIRKGDRVTSEASWGCSECWQCRHEQESLCSQRSTLGRNTNGVFAEKKGGKGCTTLLTGWTALILRPCGSTARTISSGS